MDSKKLVNEWFRKWETGDFIHLPVSDYFIHKSPF
jgi:hypothetical protein